MKKNKIIVAIIFVFILFIGLNNIILETDSPYLTPVPYRGKQNNPSHILDIAKYISEIFNVSLEEVSKITTKNVLDLYNKITID